MFHLLKIAFAAFGLLMAGTSPLYADSGVPRSVSAKATTPLDLVPDAQLVGEARLKIFIFKVYDAKLYAPSGTFDADAPFALSLTYLRTFKGKQIVKRSAKEMREQGFDDQSKLDAWQAELATIIPDVKKGDEIIGVRDTDGFARFYQSGEMIGIVKDTEFTDRFFDIWLSEKSTQPKMRSKLIGAKS